MSRVPKIGGVEHEILMLLTQRRERYGLEMVKESDRIKRGSVYVVLDRMEQKGWVKSRQEEITGQAGLPRRLYSIAAPGVAALRAADAAQQELTAFGTRPSLQGV